MRFHASGLRSPRRGQSAARVSRAFVCCLILLAIAGAFSVPASAQGGTNYVVQPGDSLGYIAATYGTTVQAIIDANGLTSPDTIWVGQTLTIPIQSSGTPASATGSGNVYTVQFGDTLGSIAASLGVDPAALVQANNLTNADQLWIGQPLLVPGRSLGTSAVAPVLAPAPPPGRYVVQPGDTLYRIATQLGVTTAALLDANNLTNADLLLVGQTLIVPGTNQPTPTEVASPTPTSLPTAAPTATATGSAPDLGIAGPDLPPTPVATATATAPVPDRGVPGSGATATPMPTATAAQLAPDSGAPDGRATPSRTPAPTASLPSFYVVQPGDTMRSIAARLGVTVADLIQANQMANPDRLSIGQTLAVPGAPTPAASRTPTPLATPDADALPPPGPLAPGLVAPPTPLPGPDHYTVQPGDTLGIIAKQFGTTAAAIARANKITSLDMLGVGTNLIIPAPDWTAPAFRGKPSRFVASISQQHCWLYQGNTVVASWTCSTGRPGSPSVPGSYKIQSKMPKAFGSAWDIWMPYWLGIYWAGATENGIHGIPTKADTKEVLWDGLVGTPITFGCIMLDQEHAKQLYDLAYIGMPVIIQR